MNDQVNQLLTLALAEDLGERGDVTANYFVPEDKQAKALVKVKDVGVICGLSIAEAVCAQVDSSIKVSYLKQDGDSVSHGDYVMEWEGPARSILSAERTALNFLQRLSGIATKTQTYVAKVAHTSCQVLDTRKTTPGWRALEKMAVKTGGGQNHRMGLYDRAMVKDNHLVAENSLEYLQQAILTLQAEHPSVEVELEADTIEQVKGFLTLTGVHYILLDNMSNAQLMSAISLRDAANSEVKLEASGGVTLGTIQEIAETGVDYVSVGALTHSAVALDISLEFIPTA